jgi:hypothetical protein
MPATDLDRFRERLRQSRTARTRAVLDDAASIGCPEGRMGCSYTPGARVFDRVSGLEGEVIGGTVETVLVPTPERREG